MKPKKVNILGTVYTIEYLEKPADVDPQGREPLFGQIDYWDRTIRIYDNGRMDQDIWQALIHEILHGIGAALNLKLNEEKMHDELDTLATALTDVFFRNKWIKE